MHRRQILFSICGKFLSIHYQLGGNIISIFMNMSGKLKLSLPDKLTQYLLLCLSWPPYSKTSLCIFKQQNKKFFTIPSLSANGMYAQFGDVGPPLHLGALFNGEHMGYQSLCENNLSMVDIILLQQLILCLSFT